MVAAEVDCLALTKLIVAVRSREFGRDHLRFLSVQLEKKVDVEFLYHQVPIVPFLHPLPKPRFTLFVLLPFS